jgi:hypothetical protein
MQHESTARWWYHFSFFQTGASMPGFFSRRFTTAAICATLASLTSVPAFAADEHQHEHADARDVAAFHNALAPLWHAPAGKARIDNACAKADTLDQLARDIKSRQAGALQEVTGMFKDKCKNNPAEAEAVFGKMHDAFHRVSEHKE